MSSDIRVQQAREHHRRSQQLADEADQHRQLRNRLVRRLREEDPKRWSYRAIAKAVGCTPELVAAIIKGRVP